MKQNTSISVEDAERLKEIAQEMAELLGEFKDICRANMSRNDYDQFKYRTLGNVEPGISEEHDWVTKYSSIDSLEKVAENLYDIAEDEENEEEEEGEDDAD